MRYKIIVLYRICKSFFHFVVDIFHKTKSRDFLFETIYRIYNHYHSSNTKIRTVSIFQLLSLFEKPIIDEKCEWTDGNVASFELEILCSIVKKLSPEFCFEFGTYNGRTTYHLALNTEETATVYTLDIRGYSKIPILNSDPRDDEYMLGGRISYLFKNYEINKKIIPLTGDSALFDISQIEGRFQFVFIDGGHSYNYVINDTKIALRLIGNNKGYIVWHDYNAIYWDGVTQAINNLYLSDFRFRDVFTIKGTTLAVLPLNH